MFSLQHYEVWHEPIFAGLAPGGIPWCNEDPGLFRLHPFLSAGWIPRSMPCWKKWLRPRRSICAAKSPSPTPSLLISAFAKYFMVNFSALRDKGARVQRPLWGSTGTKNPAYSDVLYLEELIGPDTVNTVPPKTLQAFCDHGRVHPTLKRIWRKRKRISHSWRTWESISMPSPKSFRMMASPLSPRHTTNCLAALKRQKTAEISCGLKHRYALGHHRCRRPIKSTRN